MTFRCLGRFAAYAVEARAGSAEDGAVDLQIIEEVASTEIVRTYSHEHLSTEKSIEKASVVGVSDKFLLIVP